MTLGELRDAINELLNNEGVHETDRIGVEHCGNKLDICSVAMVVSSDLWETGMVVLTIDYIDDEEGEADDG